MIAFESIDTKYSLQREREFRSLLIQMSSHVGASSYMSYECGIRKFSLQDQYPFWTYCFVTSQSASRQLRIPTRMLPTCALPLRTKYAPEGAILYSRRERDSNPRRAFTLNGFQDHRQQPLGHPSRYMRLPRWSKTVVCG